MKCIQSSRDPSQYALYYSRDELNELIEEGIDLCSLSRDEKIEQIKVILAEAIKLGEEENILEAARMMIEVTGHPPPFLLGDRTHEQCHQAMTDMALDDPVAWRACEILCAELLENGSDLTPPLRDFSANVLLKRITPPTYKPGNNPHELTARNDAIGMAVCLLVGPDTKATRNPATPTKESACEIVAEAFIKLSPKRPLGQGSVYGIYRKYAEKYKHLPE